MFKSVDHALKWASRVAASPIIKMSSVNSMRAPSGKSDLTQHDKHAQAALIMSLVERVCDRSGMAYIAAQYGGIHALSSEAMDILVRLVTASLPTGMWSRRGIEKLIRIYFGADIGAAACMKDFGVGKTKLYEIRKAAYSILDQIWLVQQAVLDEELRRHSLITEYVEKNIVVA